MLLALQVRSAPTARTCLSLTANAMPSGGIPDLTCLTVSATRSGVPEAIASTMVCKADCFSEMEESADPELDGEETGGEYECGWVGAGGVLRSLATGSSSPSALYETPRSTNCCRSRVTSFLRLSTVSACVIRKRSSLLVTYSHSEGRPRIQHA